MDNGQKLRELIVSTNLTQEAALKHVNRGQARPIALSTWKAYLAADVSARKRACPDHILKHAQKVLGKLSVPDAVGSLK